jgi:hypothetical protein
MTNEYEPVEMKWIGPDDVPHIKRKPNLNEGLDTSALRVYFARDTPDTVLVRLKEGRGIHPHPIINESSPREVNQ